MDPPLGQAIQARGVADLNIGHGASKPLQTRKTGPVSTGFPVAYLRAKPDQFRPDLRAKPDQFLPDPSAKPGPVSTGFPVDQPFE